LLGNIIINKVEGSVMVNGEVNMQKGLVEYLACSSRGKIHESVLKLDVEPYYLQIALLLIGLEPAGTTDVHQGEVAAIDGDPMEIWVRWKGKNNRPIKIRAEKLILNLATKKPLEEMNWMFTGSQIMDDRFMAQREQSIVAIYHDPFAILDHPRKIGADDTLFYANTDLLPAAGTFVDFIIRSKK